jgi:lipoprotein LprG
MVLRRIVLGAVLLVAAAGCSSNNQSSNANLPDAGSLLSESAAATKNISSAHFTLKVNGTIPGLSVHNAEGDLTKAGAAKGTVSMELIGSLFEGEFVLVDGSIYIKGATGGFQKMSASLISAVYDPGAILNPDKGIAKVIGSVQSAKTVAKEDVGGTQAYKVTGRVTKDVASAIVPGVSSDVDIALWLREDNKLPAKASVTMPGADNKPATVDVTLSNIDKPVTITAPT